MAHFKITEFSVGGLHGELDLTIPIADNKVVLVGINGLGKSTVLNIFYLTMARQWTKLSEQPFERISYVLNEIRYSFTREELQGYTNARRDVVRAMPRYRHFHEEARAFEAPELLSILDRPEAEQRNFFADLGIPPSEFEYFRHLTGTQRRATKTFKSFISVTNALSQAIRDQIVFLPTYRRIEKDLNVVLPGLEGELKRNAEHRRRARQKSGTVSVELVEFGMEDVEETFRLTLNRLKEAARAELNNLAGSYLRDVIRGEGRDFDKAFIETLTDEELEDTLNRVEENTLSEDDKHHLRGVIQKIREGGKTTSDDESVAHFLAKLLGVGGTLRENEMSVAGFVSVCNEYLEGKSFVYDEVKYELTVTRDDGRPIELRHLSSGEKQIVSLFSHVYLSSPGPFIVIIDEPELSLSVNWQSRLLPDLAQSGRCSLVAAVTHSPFIFDNEFDQHAVDMAQIVRQVSGHPAG